MLALGVPEACRITRLTTRLEPMGSETERRRGEEGAAHYLRPSVAPVGKGEMRGGPCRFYAILQLRQRPAPCGREVGHSEPSRRREPSMTVAAVTPIDGRAVWCASRPIAGVSVFRSSGAAAAM
jgi:hypothetical protein